MVLFTPSEPPTARRAGFALFALGFRLSGLFLAAPSFADEVPPNAAVPDGDIKTLVDWIVKTG